MLFILAFILRYAIERTKQFHFKNWKVFVWCVDVGDFLVRIVPFSELHTRRRFKRGAGEPVVVRCGEGGEEEEEEVK